MHHFTRVGKKRLRFNPNKIPYAERLNVFNYMKLHASRKSQDNAEHYWTFLAENFRKGWISTANALIDEIRERGIPDPTGNIIEGYASLNLYNQALANFEANSAQLNEASFSKSLLTISNLVKRFGDHKSASRLLHNYCKPQDTEATKNFIETLSNSFQNEKAISVAKSIYKKNPLDNKLVTNIANNILVSSDSNAAKLLLEKVKDVENKEELERLWKRPDKARIERVTYRQGFGHYQSEFVGPHEYKEKAKPWKQFKVPQNKDLRVVLGKLPDHLKPILINREGSVIIVSDFYEDFIESFRFKKLTNNEEIHLFYANAKNVLDCLPEASVTELFITQAPNVPLGADKILREYDEELCAKIGKVMMKDGVLCVNAAKIWELENIEPNLNKAQVFRKIGKTQTSVSETASITSSMWIKN